MMMKMFMYQINSEDIKIIRFEQSEFIWYVNCTS